MVDTRKRVSNDYIANEEKEAEIRKAIIECSSKAKLKVTLLNANDIKENEIEKFNDYCFLKEYIIENFYQPNPPFLLTDYEKVHEICEKYSTKYAAVLINRNIISRTSGFEYGIALFLTLFISPVGVPYLISCFFPDKDFTYIFGVIDLKSNELVFVKVFEFNQKEKMDLFKSQFYASLIQLKGKNKKGPINE